MPYKDPELRRKCARESARRSRAADPEWHRLKVYAHRDKNRERYLAQRLALRLRNIEQRRAEDRERYARDPAAKRAKAARYSAAHPGKRCALEGKRRAAQLQRTPPWVDLTRIEIVYECAAQMSRELGVCMSVDHEIPLQGKLVSGLHVHENLKIIPLSENSRKSNRFTVAV